MVRLKGPLMSMSASGSIGPRLTFSQRKSGPQVRFQRAQKDVVSVARTRQRDLFTEAVSAWNSMTLIAKEVYNERAVGTVMNGYDLFQKEYLKNPYFKISLTIYKTKVGGALTDYPVYIDLSLMPAHFWTHVKNGGGDIRIKTSADVECPLEVVSCDTSLHTGEVWSKLPSVSVTVNTVFYLYYGDPYKYAYGVTETYGRDNVWPGSSYHLRDLTSSTVLDSNGNYNGTKFGGADAPVETTGKIGKAQLFNGNSNLGGINTNDVIDTSQPFSFIAWVNQTNSQLSNDRGIIDKYLHQTNVSDLGARITISATSSGKLRMTIGGGTGGGGNIEQTLSWASNFPTGQYVFVAGVYDGTNLILCQNGVCISTPKTITPTNLVGTVRFGNTKHSNGTLLGIIDEARVYCFAVTTQFLLTKYNNEVSPATFYTVSPYMFGKY